MLVGQACSAEVTSAWISPFGCGHERPIGLDHVGDGEEPAVLRDKPDEVEGEAADSGLGATRLEGGELISAEKTGRAHEPLQIVGFIEQGLKVVRSAPTWSTDLASCASSKRAVA